MKVLQVNAVYKKGSTGKITYDIHHALEKSGIESVVCYGRGEKTSDINVYKVCGEFYSYFNHFMSKCTGIMYGGCFVSTLKLKRIIKRERPDIVHIQCINGYFVNIYDLILWLCKNRIKTVITLHAEFMYTANCGHSLECERWKIGCGQCPRYKTEIGSYFFDNTSISWNKMYKSFQNFNQDLIVTSVSPWLMNRAMESPIMKNKKHRVVLNGLNTEVFHYYNETELLDVKRKYSITNEKIIFHATPFFTDDKNHIKGGNYVIELARKLSKYNFKVIVAGAYKENIDVPDNLFLLGKITDQNELAKLYSIANLTVLTSKKETFSMVTAESLCCGTPVVGFRAGGPEQISIEKYSEFVNYGDLDKLFNVILNWNRDSIDKKEISQQSKQRFGRDKMCENYINVYKELIKLGEGGK